MKLSLGASLITLASFAINGVNACWQVHAMLASDPFAGDFLQVQAKNNDVEVCNSGATIFFASSESVWTINCGNLVFTMTDNGKAGHVSDPDSGYEADLALSSTQEDYVDCYCNDRGCLNCLQVESCLDDNFWNCDLYPYCAFCDYRLSC